MVQKTAVDPTMAKIMAPEDRRKGYHYIGNIAKHMQKCMLAYHCINQNCQEERRIPFTC